MVFIMFLSHDMLLSPCRSPQLQKHSQPHRPRLHSGSHQLRARPSWPGFVQRARPGDVRPTQTQVLGGGAETTAHDQESSQGLHSRRPEGNLELVHISVSEPMVLWSRLERKLQWQWKVDRVSPVEGQMSGRKRFILKDVNWNEKKQRPFVLIIIDLD